MTKNYGIDLVKEIATQSEEDWKFGALSQPCLVSIPLSERDSWLPVGEIQQGKEDTMDCASRAPNNILEAKFTYGYQHKVFNADNMAFLERNNYVVNGRITFSDAFVAINSGTTKDGNSLKAPLQAIHSQGLIPKAMLPLEHWMTLNDYLNPTRITQEMYALGAEFADRFLINYERVDATHFKEAINDDFLDVAGHAWDTPVNGIYLRSDGQVNHVFAGFKPLYYIFDNYLDFDGDFVKRLAPDYDFFDYGYRVFISGEGQQVVSLMQQVISLLTKLRDYLLSTKLGAILRL